MKNEKAEALESNDFRKLNNNEKTTMNNLNSNQQNFQTSSRNNLLDQLKLSQMAERKPTFDLQSVPFPKQQPDSVVCIGCGGRLAADDTFQQSIRVCRKCLTLYARIDAAFEERAKRTRRELLEKIAGGID